MSVAEAVFEMLGTVVAALTAGAALLWWAYKRGEAAGADRAERDAAQAASQARSEQQARELAEIRAELDALQPNGEGPPDARRDRASQSRPQRGQPSRRQRGRRSTEDASH